MSTTFCEKLFSLRRARKLLQKEVAFKVGIDQSYLATLEKGRRDPPRPKILNRIADVVCASDSDRQELMRLAANAKLLSAVEEAGDSLWGREQIEDLLAVLPRLTKTKLDAISAVVNALGTD